MAVFASGANDSDVIMKVGVYCNGDAAVGGIAQSLTCSVKTEILSNNKYNMSAHNDAMKIAAIDAPVWARGLLVES